MKLIISESSLAINRPLIFRFFHNNQESPGSQVLLPQTASTYGFQRPETLLEPLQPSKYLTSKIKKSKYHLPKLIIHSLDVWPGSKVI